MTTEAEIIDDADLHELTPAKVRRRGVIDLGDLDGEDVESGLAFEPRPLDYIDCSLTVSEGQWRAIRDYVGHRADWTCEFCSHECGRTLRIRQRFSYEEGRETLTALVGACDSCTRILDADLHGDEESLYAHYSTVAGIDVGEVDSIAAQAQERLDHLGDGDRVFDSTLLRPWLDVLAEYDL